MKQCFRLVLSERSSIRHWTQVVKIRLKFIGDDRRGQVILALIAENGVWNARRWGQVVRPRVIEYFLKYRILEIGVSGRDGSGAQMMRRILW